MKPFSFKQFNIQQTKNVFRVGTDGVLLGALASVETFSNVLEVGTGTGLISLMLAQRNFTAKFLGIDINEEAANITKINFEIGKSFSMKWSAEMAMLCSIVKFLWLGIVFKIL